MIAWIPGREYGTSWWNHRVTWVNRIRIDILQITHETWSSFHSGQSSFLQELIRRDVASPQFLTPRSRPRRSNFSMLGGAFTKSWNAYSCHQGSAEESPPAHYSLW